ncbi:MAG TPA: sigma-54 dependent transcriptional regulator [Chitinophaga sp.]|nr:sigma-54 dependent transcriptional regulator [Chitinophaga sp.]
MPDNGKILIVEDEFIVANDLRHILKKAGYTVCGIAASVEQAYELIEEKKPDWVLLDIMLKGHLTGIDLGKELMQKKIPFLYISANTNASILEAAKVTRPYGFLIKPFREKDLFVMLDIASYRYNIEKERVQDEDVPAQPGMTGDSPAAREFMEQIRIVSPTETSVLITGESGTGKELAARTIHRLSSRSNKPFVVVNCAAITLSLIETELFGHEKGAFTGASQKRPGKFEQADGGTIFLDEIGELPPDAQVKLLRVLQEKEIERVGGDESIKVDVRIIAATNRTLEREVAEGRFRLDLYYRFSVFPIMLPPLRERQEDIQPLAHHFLEKYAQKNNLPVPSVSPEAMQQLVGYSWPGNIRELEHLMERYVLLYSGSEIDHIELPGSMPLTEDVPVAGKTKTMDEMERAHIMNALQAADGKVSGPGGAAEMLGIPAPTLYSKIKRLGIKQAYK